MSKLKAGIIGLGRIAWKFEDDPKRNHPCTHAGALAALDGVELVAGTARRLESAVEFQNRWKTEKAYTSYMDMIRENQLDIIGIATNPETHADIVKEIASSGIKGILCEKPLALSLKDADEMIEACEKNNVVLITMHNRRWNGIYRKAKEIIESGELGIVHTLVGICQGCKPSKNWQSEFEGPLLHDATHLFDIMRFLMGDIEWIISDVERSNPNENVEDNANSLMRFKNGVYATTLVNERTDYMRFELEIQCSKGIMVLQTNTAKLMRFNESKYASGFKELVLDEFPPVQAMNPYMDAYQELIDSIRLGRNISVSTGEDGRAALEVIMAIYDSKRNNKQVIHLPLPGEESSLVRAIRENAF